MSPSTYLFFSLRQLATRLWTSSKCATYLLVAVLAPGLCSCVSQPANLTTPEPSAAPVQPQPPQRDLVRIGDLLWLAELSVEDDRLTTPVDDNAYLRYLQVLALDPDNSAALIGIASIVETYLAWAIDNIYQGNYGRAKDFINRANSVDETHPNIEPVRRLLARYQNGQVQVYEFERQTIESAPQQLSGQLTHIAMEINQNNANVVIEAPTDKIGRWLYQQLNLVFEDRISARFELTNRVRVHLHY